MLLHMLRAVPGTYVGGSRSRAQR